MTMHDPAHRPDIALPDEIPVFPLAGVLLLPRGQLPLNIFEPRYLAMVDDSLASNRLIGMIQPQEDAALFRTGCVGRIVNFAETDDHRYLITLRGLCRFHVGREISPAPGGYRRIAADWSAFTGDPGPAPEINIDRKKLRFLLHSYFDMEGMNCDWDMIDKASDDTLVTCLSMVCPLDAGDKQALLEAACCKTRADLFMTLLEMATRDIIRKEAEKSRCH